jgi:hypothetical protein
MLGDERGFPGGFWHPEDGEAPRDVLEGTLSTMGLPRAVIAAATRAAAAAPSPAERDEDEARRGQIERAVAAVNAALRAAGDARALIAFDDDDLECSHVLVTPDEQQELAARAAMGTVSD